MNPQSTPETREEYCPDIQLDEPPTDPPSSPSELETAIENARIRLLDSLISEWGLHVPERILRLASYKASESFMPLFTNQQSQIDRLTAENKGMREALEELSDWQSHDSVAGNGDYDTGLMCGIEDHGYQKDGYSAMRYGYDRALERVSEQIDETIAAALALLSTQPKDQTK